MFSKISEFLRPAGAIHDDGQKQKPEQRKNKAGKIGDNDDAESGFFSGDVVMFSIDAVRGLLAKHEGIADEAFRALGFLEQHGIKSLAVRDGQPVMDAVIDAQKILKGV